MGIAFSIDSFGTGGSGLPGIAIRPPTSARGAVPSSADGGWAPEGPSPLAPCLDVAASVVQAHPATTRRPSAIQRVRRQAGKIVRQGLIIVVSPLFAQDALTVPSASGPSGR